MGILTNISANPRLAYYYAQKAIRKPYIRAYLSRALINCLPASAKFTAPSYDQTAFKALRDSGIAYLPSLQLTAESIAEIMGHLRAKPVIDLYSGRKIDSLENLDRQYTKVQYTNYDTASCLPLVYLANHPSILATVARYLGAKPRISTMQVWWTYGEHSQTGQQHFDDVYHRDVDDLRFIKLFVYLTNATVTTGAHSFVKGSHRSDLLTRRGPITDADVHSHFSSEDIETVVGSAGTVFLEDTWGIHRPLLATEGRRLIFSVLYGLTDWIPQRPSRPVLPLPAGLDAYTNRAYFSQP
jgi:Phytanoyl-CoA dioxygenase (PhyH)